MKSIIQLDPSFIVNHGALALQSWSCYFIRVSNEKLVNLFLKIYVRVIIVFHGS